MTHEPSRIAPAQGMSEKGIWKGFARHRLASAKGSRVSSLPLLSSEEISVGEFLETGEFSRA